MNNAALCILEDSVADNVVGIGYANVLKAIGWKVFEYRPVCKSDVVSIIDQLNVSVIFVSCGDKIRFLPVDVINQRNILVIVMAAQFNRDSLSLGGRNRYVTPDDVTTVGLINRRILHTPIEQHMWDRYFNCWFEHDIPLLHIPLAGDLILSNVDDLSPLYHMSIVANMEHRIDTLKEWILPLLMRTNGRLITKIHGDNLWHTIGVNDVTNFVGNPSEIYSRSNVCVNLHTTEQVANNSLLNERTFTAAMCGGLPIVNTNLAAKYFGNILPVANNPTMFINMIEHIGSKPEIRFAVLKDLITYTAMNHSYFNRLQYMFAVLGINDVADELQRIGTQTATKHIWKVEASLTRKDNGNK